MRRGRRAAYPTGRLTSGLLLRRIKHHVVNENWFAVFVDFVIVVVGVYVGIEVSNWNEARQEEARATEYLELQNSGDLNLISNIDLQANH